MKRTLTVAFAALGLIAWVDPKTAGPTVSKEAAAAEARQQALYVIRAKLKDERRVNDIAFRIQAACVGSPIELIVGILCVVRRD